MPRSHGVLSEVPGRGPAGDAFFQRSDEGSGRDGKSDYSRAVAKGNAVLMASDSMPGKPYHPGNNFWVALKCESAEETEKLFTAFSANAKVVMPVQETFWAARFGMLTDQFGVNWMFNFEKPRK
jgi:uncharacterized glyoxalase superfamily protein PhnB